MNRLLSLIIILLLLAGCTPMTNTEDVQITVGSFDDLNYQNDYFHLGFTLTKNWDAYDAKRLAKRYNMKLRVMDDAYNSSDALKKRSSFPLAYASKYPVGKSIDITPALEVIATKLDDANTTATDFLAQYQKGLDANKVDYEVVENRESTLGDVPCTLLRLSIKDEPRDFTQITYCTIIKGYAITFTGCYSAQRDGKDMAIILESIYINNKY